MSINIQPTRRAVYRMSSLPARTGLATATIYRDIKNGDFPPGTKIADNIRVWFEEEIEEWMKGRIARFNKPESQQALAEESVA